jgi:hypothetical protein
VIPILQSRTAEVAGDVLAYAAIIFTIPFIILAIGAPIALFLRLVLWATGTL